MMSGIRVFLEKTLHLQINLAKSAVARPSERKFLGFSFTAERESRIRIAIESRRRLAARVRELQHRGRGQSMVRIIQNLNPLLRGWIAYFQISETPSVLKELDSWVRRRLRCVLWRQWTGPRRRAHKLRSLGLDAVRAHMSAGNHRGPWWNAGSSHMGEVLPAACFRRLGLISLRQEQRRLQRAR